MSNFVHYLGVGPAIWLGISLTSVGLMLEAIHDSRNQRPFRYQPLQGRKYAALGAPMTSKAKTILLTLIQNLIVFGSLISLLQSWCIDRIVDSSPLMPNYGNPYNLWDDRMQLPLEAHKLQSGQSLMVFDADALTVVASNWTTFGFSLLVILISCVQIGNIRRLRIHNVDPVQLEAIRNTVTPSLWAHNFILLVLHYSMVLLYGIGVCAWGRFEPDQGFYTLIVLAFLTRLQYNLITDFIESLPPPHPDGRVGFPQCTPAPLGRAFAVQPRERSAAGGVEMQAQQPAPQQGYPYMEPQHVPRAQVNVPAPAAAPYYPPAYAVPVAMRVSPSAPIEKVPLLARPVQMESAPIGPRACMNCNSIATGAGVFCSVCGTRL